MVMRLRLVGALGALALLTGCDSTATRFPTVCIDPRVPAEGATLTQYRPGDVQDLTTLESTAEILPRRIQGGCLPRRDAILVKLQVPFRIERGPASRGRQVRLPWFVALVDSNTHEVLAKREFVDGVEFNPNETRATGLSQEAEILVPLGQGRRAQDYEIWVSFQLTPEQLEYNRRRSGR
jgi:hypothetical protein